MFIENRIKKFNENTRNRKGRRQNFEIKMVFPSLKFKLKGKNTILLNNAQVIVSYGEKT